MDCTKTTYWSSEHIVASRSIPKKKLTSGVISTTEACMWLNDGNAAIFNYSIPYVRYYVDGVETDTPTINKGDSFVDADCYLEGIESTYAMLLQCMGYYGVLGPIVSPITGSCGSCDNNGTTMCTITTKSEVSISNTSGDYTIEWEVAGGSILSGQGTNVIEVRTTGLYSVMLEIRCVVTDKYITTVRERSCLHSRTHNQVGDTVLVPHVALKPRPDLVPLTGEIQ